MCALPGENELSKMRKWEQKTHSVPRKEARCALQNATGVAKGDNRAQALRVTHPNGSHGTHWSDKLKTFPTRFPPPLSHLLTVEHALLK